MLMLTLKRFLFGIFLLDHLIIRKGFSVQFLSYDPEERTFWDAWNICQVYNLTLPVLETREDYEDFWNFLTTSDMDELWLGLQWNNLYGGFYQWLNGNILGIQNWAMFEPRSQTGQRCVYAGWNQKWFTLLCSSNKKVVCFYEGHRYRKPNHSRAPTGVANYTTAFEVCRETGGRLPVLVTPADQRLLFSTRYSDFWLGLVENDGQFVWITGKKLEMYYWTNDGGPGFHVRAHKHDFDPYVTMHSPPEEFNRETEHFCCQNRSIKNGKRMSTRGAIITSDWLKETPFP
ncbi:hypothetical protein LOTGIDRAFT_169408 [Lottia gigantea]|uniref:C-type lectin domain-containing protein n=1 Tax=Lottia gigantea TaxID=225164 RepID=V3ZLT2_LOTGI|nr:hypothetical protein LOTGIDRAFT_169408 [Lottia gigantea]ESO83345.1 hypothetical protein LOTGIDRAFT_169408 [Lottia gigantea]